MSNEALPNAESIFHQTFASVDHAPRLLQILNKHPKYAAVRDLVMLMLLGFKTFVRIHRSYCLFVALSDFHASEELQSDARKLIQKSPPPCTSVKGYSIQLHRYQRC